MKLIVSWLDGEETIECKSQSIISITSSYKVILKESRILTIVNVPVFSTKNKLI